MTTDSAPTVLLLTAHYPPSREAGARRPASLVRALCQQGMRVHVVTTGQEVSAWTDGPAGERIRVVRVPERFSARATTRRATSGTGATVSTPAPWLVRQYRKFRAFPDLWASITADLVAAGREVAADVIYSTAPPITVHRAARQVARWTGVPWVAEYRDPWATPVSGRLRYEGSIVAPMARLLIGQLTSSATEHVAVTHGIATWLHHWGAHRVLVSANGIPDSMHPLPRPEDAPPSIAYLGEFYLSRDPTPLLDALSELSRRGDLPDAFRLDLVGDVHFHGQQSVEALVEARQLGKMVTFTGRLAHHEAIVRMQAAGVLWLLAQDQPAQVPNKLYEYLGTGRPILAWVDDAGESARILREVGGHYLITEQSTEDEVVATVRAAIAAGQASPTMDTAALARWRTGAQLAPVVRMVQELAASHRARAAKEAR